MPFDPSVNTNDFDEYVIWVDAQPAPATADAVGWKAWFKKIQAEASKVQPIVIGPVTCKPIFSWDPATDPHAAFKQRKLIYWGGTSSVVAASKSYQTTKDKADKLAAVQAALVKSEAEALSLQQTLNKTTGADIATGKSKDEIVAALKSLYESDVFKAATPGNQAKFKEMDLFVGLAFSKGEKAQLALIHELGKTALSTPSDVWQMEEVVNNVTAWHKAINGKNDAYAQSEYTWDGATLRSIVNCNKSSFNRLFNSALSVLNYTWATTRAAVTGSVTNAVEKAKNIKKWAPSYGTVCATVATYGYTLSSGVTGKIIGTLGLAITVPASIISALFLLIADPIAVAFTSTSVSTRATLAWNL